MQKVSAMFRYEVIKMENNYEVTEGESIATNKPTIDVTCSGLDDLEECDVEVTFNALPPEIAQKVSLGDIAIITFAKKSETGEPIPFRPEGEQ